MNSHAVFSRTCFDYHLMPSLDNLAHTSRCNPNTVFIVFNFFRCSNDYLQFSFYLTAMFNFPVLHKATALYTLAQ